MSQQQQQQPRINNGILVGGTVRIGGNLITTQNSGNITTTTYGGSNYTGAVNAGNKGTTITNGGNTDSSVYNSNGNTSYSGISNSTFNSNNNSNNTNSNNKNSGNTTTTVTNTNSNNRTPLPTNYQLDVPVTSINDMTRLLVKNGFHVNVDTTTSTDHKEKLIRGKSYLLPPTFLTQAQERSAAVCFIESNGDEISYGTGFMISDHLLMTNQHVLPDKETARRSKVTFGYDKPLPELTPASEVYSSQTWSFDPDTFFIQDKGVDVAVCAVSTEPKDQKRIWTTIPLRRRPTVVEGDCFNIIQHPSGGPKKFALRGWKLRNAEKGLVQYDTDTMPGSSGSPVFNDLWQLVAVHNSSAWYHNEKKKKKKKMKIKALISMWSLIGCWTQQWILKITRENLLMHSN